MEVFGILLLIWIVGICPPLGFVIGIVILLGTIIGNIFRR